MKLPTTKDIVKPSYLEKYGPVEDNDVLAGGVLRPTDFLPFLSIRGREFWLRSGSERTSLGVRELNVIIITARPTLSKRFFSKAWSGKDDSQSPDCYSLDAQVPSKNSPNPQATMCKACPKNDFGTARVGKGKACSDFKRLIVWPMLSGDAAFPCVLDVPASSLRTPKEQRGTCTMLSDYVSILNAHGIPFNAALTKMAFTDSEYPQLSFSFVRPATEEEYVLAKEMVDFPGVDLALKADEGVTKKEPEPEPEPKPEAREVADALDQLRNMLKEME